MRRIAAGLQLKSRDAAELRTLDLRVEMAEHENVAVLAVLGMEGEGGDAALHVEEQILLARRVIRAKAIDLPGVYSATMKRSDVGSCAIKTGSLNDKLIERADEPVLWWRIGRANHARRSPLFALVHPERLFAIRQHPRYVDQYDDERKAKQARSNLHHHTLA